MYENRHQAGLALAQAVRAQSAEADAHPGPDIVLGLTRGGVPVAAAVAQALGLPLDVCVVRKIGHPGQPEWALGAVAEDGRGGTLLVRDEPASPAAAGPGEGPAAAWWRDQQAQAQSLILQRAVLYRGAAGAPDLQGRHVLLVDDGLATGMTMRAAICSARSRGAARVSMAAPVGSAATAAVLRAQGVHVVCPLMPADFHAVGLHYRRFEQLDDEAVVQILRALKPSASPRA